MRTNCRVSNCEICLMEDLEEKLETATQKWEALEKWLKEIRTRQIAFAVDDVKRKMKALNEGRMEGDE